MNDSRFIGADGHDEIDHMAQLDGSIAWDGGTSRFHASQLSGTELDHYNKCYADYMKTKAMCAGLGD